MQIVTDITEHEWEYLNKLVKNGDVLGHYERLLVNGIPLPKGHGRLIDSDAYKEKVFRIFPCSDRCDSIIRRATELCLGSAETIIEEDKN